MPVLAELVGWLVAFGVFLIAWLMLQGYRVTLGALLGKIAEETRSLTIAGIAPFGWLAHDIDRINHFILYQLGQVVAASSYVWHGLLGQMAAFVHETTRALGDLAEATEGELSRLRRWAIPAAVSAAVGPLAALVYSLRRQVVHLAAEGLHTLHTITHVVTHEITKTVVRVEKTIEVRTKTAAVAVAGAAGIPLPRLGRLERDVHGIDETLRGVLRRLTPAGILGLVVAAVGTLGMSWTRCSGSQRYGRQLCGMDQDLLGSLIADTLLVLGTVDLVEFAGGMQTLTGEAASSIGSFWRA